MGLALGSLLGVGLLRKRGWVRAIILAGFLLWLVCFWQLVDVALIHPEPVS